MSENPSLLRPVLYILTASPKPYSPPRLWIFLLSMFMFMWFLFLFFNFFLLRNKTLALKRQGLCVSALCCDQCTLFRKSSLQNGVWGRWAVVFHLSFIEIQQSSSPYHIFSNIIYMSIYLGIYQTLDPKLQILTNFIFICFFDMCSLEQYRYKRN